MAVMLHGECTRLLLEELSLHIFSLSEEAACGTPAGWSALGMYAVLSSAA